MKLFLWNLLLAFMWGNVSGELSPQTLAVGFIVGFVILYFVQDVVGRSRYFQKVFQIIGFFFFFLWELILANMKVAHDVVTPTHYNKPGVIALELDAKTDVEITLLANLISLTPGTLSLDVSEDRRTLYIHAMFVEDPEALRASIKDGMERRLLEVLR